MEGEIAYKNVHNKARKEIFNLLIDNLDTSEIALELGISEKTVLITYQM